jgi:hypothetical protein
LGRRGSSSTRLPRRGVVRLLFLRTPFPSVL